MPVVVMKGGATAGGARAAASHTGSLATDDRTFDGMCRQAGVTRAATVEEAFEAAATFATQPLPTGNRVVVMTTAGGWGVVTADAITRHPDLELAALPEDLRDAVDTSCRPGGAATTRSTWPAARPGTPSRRCMELIAAHPDVDAIVYLGLGIQSNQARMLRDGPFHPDHGIERIVAYHERQDARFAQAAARHLGGHRQAHPHRHGAGRGVPGQPRTGDGAGHRTALLRLGGPGRRGAGSPVATQPVPPAAGPAPDMTDGPDPLSDEVVAPVVRARHRAAADRPGARWHDRHGWPAPWPVARRGRRAGGARPGGGRRRVRVPGADRGGRRHRAGPGGVHAGPVGAAGPGAAGPAGGGPEPAGRRGPRAGQVPGGRLCGGRRRDHRPGGPAGHRPAGPCVQHEAADRGRRPGRPGPGHTAEHPLRRCGSTGGRDGGGGPVRGGWR